MYYARVCMYIDSKLELRIICMILMFDYGCSQMKVDTPPPAPHEMCYCSYCFQPLPQCFRATVEIKRKMSELVKCGIMLVTVFWELCHNILLMNLEYLEIERVMNIQINELGIFKK